MRCEKFSRKGGDEAAAFHKKDGYAVNRLPRKTPVTIRDPTGGGKAVDVPRGANDGDRTRPFMPLTATFRLIPSPMLKLFVCVLLTLTASLRAATYTWDGSVNNLNSAHWTPGPVAWPGEGHDMILNGGVVTVTDSQTIYRPQNFVINGGTLRIVPGGGLFPGSDATSRIITVNAGGVLEVNTGSAHPQTLESYHLL